MVIHVVNKLPLFLREVSRAFPLDVIFGKDHLPKGKYERFYDGNLSLAAPSRLHVVLCTIKD